MAGMNPSHSGTRVGGIPEIPEKSRGASSVDGSVHKHYFEERKRARVRGARDQQDADHTYVRISYGYLGHELTTY